MVVRAPIRAKVVVPFQVLPNLVAALQEQLRNVGARGARRPRALRALPWPIPALAPRPSRSSIGSSSSIPNADTELHYRTPFELLIATILSAQSTDARVNIVTPALFAKYPDARALAAVEPEAVEPMIVSTGFFRSKARSIVGAARALVERHGGEVPADMDALVELPGVGRKTANVVLGHALGVPGLPVDRHVLRVANRLGIAASDDPEIVESSCARRCRRRAGRAHRTC